MCGLLNTALHLNLKIRGEVGDWQQTKSLQQLKGNRASRPSSDIIHLLHSSQRGGRMLFLFTKQPSPSLVLSDLAYIPCVEWLFQLCLFTLARATMTGSSCVGQWVYWGSCAMCVRLLKEPGSLAGSSTIKNPAPVWETTQKLHPRNLLHYLQATQWVRDSSLIGKWVLPWEGALEDCETFLKFLSLTNFIYF